MTRTMDRSHAGAPTTTLVEKAAGRPGRALALAAVAYLVLAVLVWWNVWANHPASTTTCGCGDSALFLWFFAWPAHAISHGLDPFFSTAMSHPTGVNLLDNTSELALGVVLAPVTWVFGSVASLNVALTLAPALSGLAMFVLLRRWVRWAPAAFVGGLLYGFSPLGLVSLSDAHLMLGWAVVPPLVVACVDELLFGRRRGPVVVGLVRGLLLVVQFFVGPEVLLILGIAAVPAALLLGCSALARLDAARARARRARRARRALVGLGTAEATPGILLAWPTWFALDGPVHVSGRVWPSLYLGFEGTTAKAFLWPTPASAGYSLFAHRVGGYQGPTLSGQYVGMGLVLVSVVGLLVWRRDRRLWFFGAMTVVSVVLSLGADRSVWLPWQVLAGQPVLQNIIPSRFLLVTYLSLGAILAMVVDHARAAVVARRTPVDGAGAARWGAVAGVGVAAVGLVPVAAYLSPTVPMVTQTVRSPTWFSSVAPHLPDGTVLLVFPVPNQVIESAMAWQATAGFPYAMVGGGGPGGVIERTGVERPGADAVARASFSFTGQRLRPGDVVATRKALVRWGVDEAVLPDQPGLPAYDQVTSVPYTVAFMTAVTGRAPHLQARSWVWDHAASDLPTGPGPTPSAVAACEALGVGGSPAALGREATCVLAAG